MKISNNLKAEYRIKRQIIVAAYKYMAENEGAEYLARFFKCLNEGLSSCVKADTPLEDEGTIDLIWDGFDECEEYYYLSEDIGDFRCDGAATDIPCSDSRNFEADSVGKQLSDGTWVGWTYWHGGGKHAYSEEIEWMAKAYDLDVVEVEKLVVVRTFTKKEK